MEIKEIKKGDELRNIESVIQKLGTEFLNEARINEKFNSKVFVSMWESLLKNRSGIVFIAVDSIKGVVGMIGGLRYNNFISGKSVLSEAFWFVKKENRGCGIKLLKNLEKWANDNEVEQIILSHFLLLNSDILDKLYKKWGYKPIETNYIKNLGG